MQRSGFGVFLSLLLFTGHQDLRLPHQRLCFRGHRAILTGGISRGQRGVSHLTITLVRDFRIVRIQWWNFDRHMAPNRHPVTVKINVDSTAQTTCGGLVRLLMGENLRVAPGLELLKISRILPFGLDRLGAILPRGMLTR